MDADADGHEVLLREAYEYWRGAGDVEEATLAWAEWLLVRKGRGDEAMRVVMRAQDTAGRGRGSLAQRWAGIVRQRQDDDEA